MPRLAAAFGLALVAEGCIVADDTTPRFESNVVASTHYVHRGMTENERGVAQADMNVDLDTTLGGTLGLNAWGNMDLRSTTGDAWMPPGHERKFTEIDLTAQYAQHFSAVDATAGVQSYTLPNGKEFQNGERGGTTEMFARVGRETILGVYAQGELRVDVDEADGWYAAVSLERDFQLAEKLHTRIAVLQGYSDGGESLWNYGLEHAGFADLKGSAALLYDYDAHTTLNLTLAGSTMVDHTLRSWFDDIGINPDVLWIAAGVTFRY
jgi:hypothetical protein